MESTAIITKSAWKNDNEKTKVVGKMTAKVAKVVGKTTIEVSLAAENEAFRHFQHIKP